MLSSWTRLQRRRVQRLRHALRARLAPDLLPRPGGRDRGGPRGAAEGMSARAGLSWIEQGGLD